ncbi:hypothetical protein [Pseudogemmobacter humi]|uniref:N,N-dimethylformamidase alpha subunit n=1 Tax=Pseudogemmobacter humi TaxID=2483812 RepID=A0A3P5XBJ7_9RHOB|nr:hypothetical protein [Pseudogemmobacter humi]VDC24874.1 N,N-dimethylformamidase alpha subunit [Pseudogemmobacter humi]
MTDPDIISEDADIHVRANFDRFTRAYLLSVLSDALIEEHRLKPEGHHSEPLTRLLNWCQTRPLDEQYAVLAGTDGRFRVVRLSGKRRVPPAPVGTESYATVREARHAAFLNHIKDLTGK